jgi:hypothetical protein
MGLNDQAPLLAHIQRCLGGQFHIKEHQKGVRNNRYLALAAPVDPYKDPETLLYLFYPE